MGNENIRVGEGSIQQSARIVRDARSDLRSELSKLEGQMEQVKQHWEGVGSAAFQNVQRAWSVQAKDLVDLLDTFEQNLISNDKQYTADDQGSADLLSKYTSQMGGK